MDFLEKSHLPSCSTAGMRRSIAIWVTTFSSIARYREASLTSMVSLGSTSIDHPCEEQLSECVRPPGRPPYSVARSPLPANGSGRPSARVFGHAGRGDRDG